MDFTCCSFPWWNLHRQNHKKMAELQPSILTRSHLFTEVTFSVYLLLLLLWCLVETTSACPTSSKTCRSACCLEKICAAPAVHPLICAITSLKTFSKIILCVFDPLWPADSRGLLSLQVATSSGSLAIALHWDALSEGVSPLCFTALLLAWLWGRHRDLKPPAGRGNKTLFSAALDEVKLKLQPPYQYKVIPIYLTELVHLSYDLVCGASHIQTIWGSGFDLSITCWITTISPIIFQQECSVHA